MNSFGYLCSMKLHLFNPEHDMALAAGQPEMTVPHAGRELRSDLSFLPALTAADGDWVLVDNVEAARQAMRRVKKYAANVTFITPAQLQVVPKDIDGICPWGWDMAVKKQLSHLGLQEPLLPTDDMLADIRMMSSRRWAATHLLAPLMASDERLCGRAEPVKDLSAIADRLADGRRYVLKAPWSSSGRGVKYVEQSVFTDSLRNWTARIIRRQGFIMLEPYYNKVCDFGMEFHADGSHVRFAGLSLFETTKAAYAGSLVAREADKRALLGAYLPLDLLDAVQQRLETMLSALLRGRYAGPLGIDMMVVADEARRLLLHPCVELNLRQTMGHVALSLQVPADGRHSMMRVLYDGHYKFRIQTAPGR